MRGLLVLLCPLFVLAAACGGGDGDEDQEVAGEEDQTTTESPVDTEAGSTTEQTAEQDTTGSTAPASTTSAPASSSTSGSDGETLPVTSLTVTLDTFYDFPNGPLPGGELPFDPGEIRVWWYVEGDHYTVLYEGLSTDLAACPGNSIQLASGVFDFVSNASLGDIDCSASPTGIENSPDQGVVVCGPLVFYRTLIPADATGTLFGTVEIYDSELLGVGATSMAPTAPGQAAAIDLGSYGC